MPTVSNSDLVHTLFAVVPFVAAVVVVWAIRYLYSIIYSLRRDNILLEITPAAFDDRPMEATSALFSALHSMGHERTFKEKFIGAHSTYSLEIVSSKAKGVRFVIRAPKEQEESVRTLIKSYVHSAKVRRIEDYANTAQGCRLFRLSTKKHFAYPLQAHDQLQSHDPIGYIASAMTGLEGDEQIILQTIIQPRRLREAESLRQKILHNENFLPGESHRSSVGGVLLRIIHTISFGILDLFSTAYDPSINSAKTTNQRLLNHDNQVAKGERPARTLSYFEHELVESISHKLKQPLFKTRIRIAIVATDKNRAKQKKKSLKAAFGLYDVPKYQGLKLTPVRLATKWLKSQIVTRRLMFRSSMYLASSELASLFHFPNAEASRTDDLVQSLSKTLPAPIAHKSNKEMDVYIGNNQHHGETTPIGLTEAERQRHMYIVGGTGNGKTTMIKYQMMQDIESGKGIALVDPHGDLAEEILGLIPEHRMKDVVYINPDDLDMPVGVNLLELQEGLTGNDLLREKDLVTESTVSVLRKIFSEDDSGGHRIEYVLRNTIQTALTLDSANLFTIFRLLNDKKFRNQTVNKLEDTDLKNFWKQELGKAGDMQRIKMAAGITSKIGRFLFSASARGMLEQDKSTIDFEQIMDEQKILICNFSKGLLGEDTSALFGITILAKLQIASLKRARQQHKDRKSFLLYVDEFQNFATTSFVQMLSEARKYKLFLIMAEQSTQQQDDQRLVEIILANVGTVVAFRSGSPRDEQLIQPLFAPYVDVGELSNLPAYSFYTKINAVDTQEPTSGTTVLLDKEPNREVAARVKDLSRDTYGHVGEATVNSETASKKKSQVMKKPVKKPTKPKEKKSPREIKQFA